MQVLRESLPRLQLPPGAVIGPALPGLGWSGSLALGQMNEGTMPPPALPSTGTAASLKPFSISLLQPVACAHNSHYSCAHAASSGGS